MNNYWTWLFVFISAMASPQRSAPAPAQDSGVMLAAVSLDARVFRMSFGEDTAKGPVYVEPMGLLTPSGEWRNLPCFADRDGKHYANQDACLEFERDYLNKPHTYTLVSAAGPGGTVTAAPTKLSECFGYTGSGTYSGADIRVSAIGASSIEFFSDSPPPQLIQDAAAAPLLKAFAAVVPVGLDSTLFVSVFSLRLEGQDLALLQRSYGAPAGKPLKPIFAIGKMDQGRFQVLHWKET